jgi:hypothetical protein
MFIDRLLKAGRREDLMSDGSKIVFCLIAGSVPALVLFERWLLEAKLSFVIDCWKPPGSVTESFLNVDCWNCLLFVSCKKLLNVVTEILPAGGKFKQAKNCATKHGYVLRNTVGLLLFC